MGRFCKVKGIAPMGRSCGLAVLAGGLIGVGFLQTGCVRGGAIG